MKKYFISFSVLVAGLALVAAIKAPTTNHKGADVKSISALAFGPDGILFIGDSKSATVFAVSTKDTKKQNATAVDVKQIDEKIAAALGTTKENIKITDMAVNPLSKKVYIAVQTADGTPVLLILDGDKLVSVSLKDLGATSVVLNDAPAEDAKDQRGNSMRISSISDIGYDNGKLLVTGISNHEFNSSFKSIPYPFTSKQDESTLEIYHASHGRYETKSPIRTFTTATINGKKYLVASYTCTPLVLFDMSELKPGTHVKGRTVAEMGAGNSPIDMVTLKSNAPVLVMNNTRYPVAKVDYKNIAAFEGTLTEQVKGTGGVSFAASNLTNVLQMDKLDDSQVVMIQKKADGSIDLWTANESNL